MERTSSLLRKLSFRKSTAGATDGWTPLHFAAEENEPAALQAHIDRGCAVDAVDERGNTPLHLACRQGHVGIVQALLLHRADPTVRNRDGKTPMDYARKARREFVVAEIEASLRREAERQRIEQQCERAEAEVRARQRASMQDAVKARSEDRVKAAAARRQALEARREELKQQRLEEELKAAAHQRVERARSERESAAKTLRRKLSFGRKPPQGAAPPRGPEEEGDSSRDPSFSRRAAAPAAADTGATGPAAGPAATIGASLVRKMSFGRKPSFERGRARKGKAHDAEPATVPADVVGVAIRPPDGSAVSLSDLLPEPQTTPERSRGLVDFLNAKEGC